KKDKNLIPPVADSAPSRDGRSRSPYRSNANTYVASRDGDPYSSARGGQGSDYIPSPGRGKDSRNADVGGVYTRGNARLEDDRNELFSGDNPEKSGPNRFTDGPQPLGEDEDVEGIRQQTRFVKQESVNSTRNALRLAREAEDSARNTLGRLGEQSGTVNCI